MAAAWALSDDMASRINLLKELLEHRRRVASVCRDLNDFEWDSEELVILSSELLQRMLTSYLEGQTSNGQLTNWAEAIEGRDDAGWEPRASEAIHQCIFELANPVLEGPITPANVQKWLARLIREDSNYYQGR